jgi:hypothetical protein
MSKDSNRDLAPTIAAIVDEYREWMTNGGKIIYASENGRVLDRRTPEIEVYVLDPNRFRLPAVKAAK